jgi:hypothetical protein
LPQTAPDPLGEDQITASTFCRDIAYSRSPAA